MTMTRRAFGFLAVGAVRLTPGTTDVRSVRLQADRPRGYRYVHLDVFTDKKLAGNQLLVFVDPGGLTTEQMQALTRDVVDFHGKFFEFTNVPIELKPLQRPHPPLWYATTSTEGAARAARENMSIVTLVETGFAAKIIAAYKEAWREAHGASGKKMPHVGITRFVYLSEDEQHAKEHGALASHQFHENLVYLWKKYNATAVSLDEVKRAAQTTLVLGKPAQVRERIEQELEQTGANYYVPRFAFGNLTHEESVRSLELFVGEVMPHFQK